MRWPSTALEKVGALEGAVDFLVQIAGEDAEVHAHFRCRSGQLGEADARSVLALGDAAGEGEVLRAELRAELAIDRTAGVLAEEQAGPDVVLFFLDLGDGVLELFAHRGHARRLRRRGLQQRAAAQHGERRRRRRVHPCPSLS